jgi:hypothetical protein
MVSSCAGLILVHYTTQEYFERTRQIWFPDAETLMTVACMAYLSYDDSRLTQQDPWRRVPDLSFDHYASFNGQPCFYRYAALYWGQHAKNAPLALPYVMRFLRRPGRVQAAANVLNLMSAKHYVGNLEEIAYTSLSLSTFFWTRNNTCRDFPRVLRARSTQTTQTNAALYCCLSSARIRGQYTSRTHTVSRLRQ